MRAVTASLARVAKPRAGVAPRGRSASCPSRRGWRTSCSAFFFVNSDAPGARRRRAASPGCDSIPRERASHGPTYAFGAAGTPEAKGALRLRFLAFHGCGARFTAAPRPPRVARGGRLRRRRAERVGGAAGAATWTAPQGVFEAPRAKTTAASARGVAVPRRRVRRRGARETRAVRRGLGSRRCTRAKTRRWSARRAAFVAATRPRRPRRERRGIGADALVCVDGGYSWNSRDARAPGVVPARPWRLRGAGPGVGQFPRFAEAFRGVDAVAARPRRARAPRRRGRGRRVGDDARLQL